MSKSKIEWTDYSWNPVTGCTEISSGCHNCYARRMAIRFNHGSFAPTLHPERLSQPFSWKKPRKVFVCSIGDLFHSLVPDSFLNQVFDTILKASWHTFLILTKRPQRINQWRDVRKLPENAWIGVSVEDQRTADVRIKALLQIPASKRFVSCEPLLEQIDIQRYLWESEIDWVICGGESGPGARECDEKWLLSLRDQCLAVGVPLFVKQDSGPRAGMQGRIPDTLWRVKEFPTGGR